MTPTEKKTRILWLMEHPLWVFGVPEDEQLLGLDPFYRHVEVQFVWVNPSTETIEEDAARNTAFRVWIEAGPPWDMSETFPDKSLAGRDRWGRSHDFNLDCGAPTVEEAFLKLADLVEQHYNGDGTDRARS